MQFDPSIIIFLSSGLFLGWALGANDAANVFGTAVGTRMIPWLTAAIICSVFLVLGAVISGGGAADTLGKLGAISTPAGAFMTALSAAIAVYTMTKAGLPVSTTQAIVGGIVGWNLFSDTATDTKLSPQFWQHGLSAPCWLPVSPWRCTVPPWHFCAEPICISCASMPIPVSG